MLESCDAVTHEQVFQRISELDSDLMIVFRTLIAEVWIIVRGNSS